MDSFDIKQSNSFWVLNWTIPSPLVQLLFHLLITLNIAVPSSNGSPEPQSLTPVSQGGHLYRTQGYLLVV